MILVKKIRESQKKSEKDKSKPKIKIEHKQNRKGKSKTVYSKTRNKDGKVSKK